jgi:hypothetical protein
MTLGGAAMIGGDGALMMEMGTGMGGSLLACKDVAGIKIVGSDGRTGRIGTGLLPEVTVVLGDGAHTGCSDTGVAVDIGRSEA